MLLNGRLAFEEPSAKDDLEHLLPIERVRRAAKTAAGDPPGGEPKVEGLP
jgi:hypothetical protein